MAWLQFQKVYRMVLHQLKELSSYISDHIIVTSNEWIAGNGLVLERSGQVNTYKEML